jgi:hypothetical protein
MKLIHHLQPGPPARMPSDHGGSIFIDVSLGQREEPGRLQVSHQQAHHSAGNTLKAGLIYGAPTRESTEQLRWSTIAQRTSYKLM